MTSYSRLRNKPYRVRHSAIHQWGVFATKRIDTGTRIVEYRGRRISRRLADADGRESNEEHPIVLLFSVNARTVIDAAQGGNEARFINHSCEPNCETVLDKGRIYIEATRDIRAGEELTYDYQLEAGGRQTAKLKSQYACNCGSKTCRGTMLAPKASTRRKAKHPNL
jgi:SET domain-containing protein